ncbi:hypothetical protein [Rubripirellula reticaptiva]|uniref:Uncharacterized protein n=1 Tax=Rubripirellula reticaptiva TaxID=2528013 RepID=A0A5C6EF20_9BACT|nr:hypothetical protein [Rubripirellula reticaptiva]TWU47115.1 hypothetical protein Poly59_60890 [Rubripirellula reticaptiva]
MTNSQRLATVRECFLCWTEGGEIESESILIRNEFFCGRRFRSSNHHAVWFIEEDTLKIFDQDNQLACVMRGDEIDSFVASEDQTDHSAPTILAIPTRPTAKPAEESSDEFGDSIRRAA